MVLWLFLSFFAAMNFAAYFLMRLDKQRAIHHQWRIAESHFFILSLFGGFIGIFVAMRQIRHKTQSLFFKIMLLLSVFIWLIFLPFAYFWLQ